MKNPLITNTTTIGTSSGSFVEKFSFTKSRIALPIANQIASETASMRGNASNARFGCLSASITIAEIIAVSAQLPGRRDYWFADVIYLLVDEQCQRATSSIYGRDQSLVVDVVPEIMQNSDNIPVATQGVVFH